ncbi:MAG TPA: hypothetical protein PK129_15485, partial [Cellvibrionaceae bacterium]|nr:hypothetical protein [Cellvibrionaceae bacterium]
MANPYCNWAAGTIINSFDSPQGASMMHTLHLLHLCSPALPIGAYAYSQGLEYAIDSGWLKNPAAIADWLLGVMDNTLSFTDLPIL